LKPTDTRPLFKALCEDLVSLLRSLPADDWSRPTLAGNWRVKDVAAHMLDTTLRRLSFHRDGLPPPSPPSAGGAREFVAYINDMNATWVRVAARLSPRVITDQFAAASRDLAAFFESLPDDAPALFPVSWAGDASAGWLDIGRDFTELWHHGAQIREAVGAGPYDDPRWLRAVIEISLHAVPYAYRRVQAADGTTVVIQITRRSGGSWVLRRMHSEWNIDEAAEPHPAALARMSDETAWRLFFNALRPATAESDVQIEGNRELVLPLLETRSVIV
jgi:uncharacterized protein (TIGR03083 family)